MPNQPQPDKTDQNDASDDYEAADLGDTANLDEDARLALADAEEKREVRREILLGQIALKRSQRYEAEEAGDAARVTELEGAIAALTQERDGL